MKRSTKLGSFAFLIITGLFSSCSTEFDVLAPYKEVPVIYGLISVNDTLHVVRVNKGFSNEGRDANDIAQNDPDSIRYGDNLEVLLVNETDRDTLFLRAVDSIPKNPGLFSFPDHIVYLGEKILDEDDSYKIIARNKSTGTTAEGRTEMVGQMELDRGLTNVSANFFDPVNNRLINKRFTLSLGENGTYVSMDGFVNIVEYYSDRDSIIRPIKIQISSGRSFNVNAGTGEFVLPAETFVTSIQSGINPANDPPTLTSRRAINIDIEVYASTRDFERYVQASNSISALSQTRPLFTNITNGLGLFTSRGVVRRAYPLTISTPILLQQRLPGYKF